MRRSSALRAGDCPGGVVDGEIRAGVAFPGTGLGGSVSEQRADQGDAVAGEFRDSQLRAEVAGISVLPGRGQVLACQAVVDDGSHLAVRHRGISGLDMGDQVRERLARAVPGVPGSVRAGLRAAARAVPASARRGIIAGLGHVQLVSQPERIPLDAPPGISVIRGSDPGFTVRETVAFRLLLPPPDPPPSRPGR